MSSFSRLFLRAKHWQLFLVIILLPTLVQAAVSFHIPGLAHPSGRLGLTNLLFTLLDVSFMSLFVYWLYTVGMFLSSIARPALRMQTDYFWLGACLLVVDVVPHGLGLSDLVPGLFLLMDALDVATLICVLYCIYFVSKNLVMAEKGASVEFSEYAVTFVFSFFIVIGIWFLQPRINRLYAGNVT